MTAREPLDPAGIAAARRFAHWYIGDRTWADMILGAYRNPEATNADLDREQS